MRYGFEGMVAVEYGVIGALVFDQIAFWVKRNSENHRNFKEGKYWTYNSIKHMVTYFPFLNERQLSYTINKLKEEDLIEVSNFNKNALDRTMWYTLTDKAFSILQKCQIENTKLSNGFDKNVKCINKDIQTKNPVVKEKTLQKRKVENAFYAEER